MADMNKEEQSMERLLMVIKVKPEMRNEYIAIHQNPWPEMLEAIRAAGFINELIWYFEDQSIIYFAQMFKKAVGISAGEYRAVYRDLATSFSLGADGGAP